MNEYIDLPHSYARWLMEKNERGLMGTALPASTEQHIHICNFPFVFDAEAKTTLLRVGRDFQFKRVIVRERDVILS